MQTITIVVNDINHLILSLSLPLSIYALKRDYLHFNVTIDPFALREFIGWCQGATISIKGAEYRENT